MKRKREGKRNPDNDGGLAATLAAYGERFMSMFDDADDLQHQPAKRAAPRGGSSSSEPSDASGSTSGTSQSGGSESEEDAGGRLHQQQQQQAVRGAHAGRKGAGSGSRGMSLEEFLGQGGSRQGGSAGQKQRAPGRPSKQQEAEQQRQQQQHQRLVERQLRKQFMSSKVAKIFDGVDPRSLQQAATAPPGEVQQQEVTAADFAAMRRDVEQLGASGLDRRSAKAHKAASLARLGAAAERRPRIPARVGLGMARKAKQRAAAALQEAIAAGMVKAKGRGKKARAEKAKSRDRGLMEAGPGFKNGVLRLPKSALR